MTALAAGAGRIAEGAASAKLAIPEKRKVKFRSGGATYQPVVTTLTVVVGVGFLKRWLVDKQAMPDRKWWIQIGILGFVLSMMAEVAPKMGKTMSYLILTSVVFAQAIPILDELEGKTQPKPRGRTPNPSSPLPGKRTIA